MTMLVLCTVHSNEYFIIVRMNKASERTICSLALLGLDTSADSYK